MKHLIILLISAVMFGAGMLLAPHTTQVDPRSYQIQLQDTTALLYDGDRLVGRFILEGELDEVIASDNQ